MAQSQICIAVNQEESRALQQLAQEKGVEVTDYLRELLSRHLQKSIVFSKILNRPDLRAHRRKKVSILGVSCVRFSDGEMRSYPVVVEDISKGGIRISFRSIDGALMNKIALADHFEVVFTVPSTTRTVSFYCRKRRATRIEGLNLAGSFEDAHETCLNLISKMILDDRQALPGHLDA